MYCGFLLCGLGYYLTPVNPAAVSRAFDNLSQPVPAAATKRHISPEFPEFPEFPSYDPDNSAPVWSHPLRPRWPGGRLRPADVHQAPLLTIESSPWASEGPLVHRSLWQDHFRD